MWATAGVADDLQVHGRTGSGGTVRYTSRDGVPDDDIRTGERQRPHASCTGAGGVGATASAVLGHFVASLLYGGELGYGARYDMYSRRAFDGVA